MNAFLLALLVSVIGVIPCVTKPKRAVGIGLAGFLLSWWAIYANNPTLATPFFGGCGTSVLLMWIISGIASAFDCDRYGRYETDEFNWSSPWLLIPILGICAFVGRGCGQSGCFRQAEYSALLGEVEKREWTQDIQPKDPKHVRLVPPELAKYLATKQLGEIPGVVGSQFEVGHLTLQTINGELWYVAPLEYKSFSAWTASKASPGFVMVHGEDPKHPVVMKMDRKFRFMESAFFGDNLERKLWGKYKNYILRDYTFEIDENGKAWWTVTATEPTIGWNGEVVKGVITLDPETGADEFYEIGKFPAWVDRVFPRDLVEDYIQYRGKFVGGWINSWWGKKDMYEAEKPSIAFTSDGSPCWVTGITSINENDTSVVGLIYTNTRTGKSVQYHVSGGTEEAIIKLVDSKVEYRKLHGSGCQLYNIYGARTAIVPILGTNHSFQGVAMVDVANMQLAVGDDIESALRQYQKTFVQSGQKIAPEKEREIKTVQGKVGRFVQEVRGGETTYFIYLENVPHLFSGFDVSEKLRITREGDLVRIGYCDSTEDVFPLINFDNLSVILKESENQKTLRQTVTERQQKVQAESSVKNAKAEVENMTPEELQELIKLRKKK